MSVLETVKKLLGIAPVDVSELNRRATGEAEHSAPQSTGGDSLDNIVITDEYRTVCEFLKADCPVVFVHGNAGTGKSTLIRYLGTVLDRRMVVVAPTGVAALNAGGVTIHSFFQLPPRIHEERDIKLVNDRKLYQKLQLLVIDEVSMVRCDLMDSVDRFLRKNRSNDTPFGGVQLLLVGDLFQLPPVVPNNEWDVLRSKGYTSPYFFNSNGMQKTSLRSVELTRVYRQQNSAFVDLLNRIRTGDDLDSAIAELNRRCYPREDFSPDITLTCTNNRADQINLDQLQRITSTEYSFRGTFEGQFRIGVDKLPAPLDLRLKVGARVMFTKNDEQRRWVNGTLGVVRAIKKRHIRVELVSDSQGTVCNIHPVTWETYKYKYDPEQDTIVAHKVGQYSQYPLMQAWAVTIHKSQGKTLDKVCVDLGSGAFAFGQAYVALSRCCSIEGLCLARPIRNTDVRSDPVIRRFYAALAEMSSSGSQGI